MIIKTRQIIPKRPAPSYLAKYVSYDKAEYFKRVLEIEWRGQVQSSAGRTLFKLKYYGDRHPDGRIVGTGFAPALVYAVDVVSGEAILLFDGCRHGFRAMFLDDYTSTQVANRYPSHFFHDASGDDEFEVIIMAYYNLNYDEKLDELVNEEEKIELINGDIISEADLRSNGFDWLGICVVNHQGQRTEVVSEELA
jgi:hypothetical protein